MQEQVGQRIRELRRARGLTQDQAAERAGTHAKYLSSIERGEVNLTIATVQRLASALDVAPAELLQGGTVPDASDRATVERLVRDVLDQGDAERIARLRVFLEVVFR